MDYIVTNRPDYFNFPNFCSIEDCVGLLLPYDSIGYDSETTSLSFADGSLRTMQFSNGTDNFIVDIEGGIKPTEFKSILEGKELIGQNLQFDIPFLYVFDIIPTKIWDSLLAEQCLTLGIKAWKRDLGSLLENYLDVTIPKDLQDVMGTIPLNDTSAIEYMFNDVRYLHALKDKMIILLQSYGMVKAHTLNCRFIKVASYLEWCGIKFDGGLLTKMYREIEAKEWFSENELNIYLTENTDIDPLKFNWASSTQVSALFKQLGYNLQFHGKETVDIKFLGKKYKNDELIKKYIEYKKYNKLNSTYGRAWESFPYSDGLVHTTFKVIGAGTGRTSSGDMRRGKAPNLQNLPAGNFRRIFKPNNGRMTFITLDYSAQEPHVMADLSQDKKLLEFFLSDENDFHSYVAREVFSELKGLSLDEIKENHNNLRQTAKSIGFTLSYNGNEFALAENLETDVDTARDLIDKYFSRFSGLRKYMDDVAKDALDKGYIEISHVTGAKRFLENYEYYKMNKYDNKSTKAYERTIEKEAINSRVQGLSAEISKTACILFFDWIVSSKNFKKVLINNMVHDEILISCNKAKADDIANKAKECMELAGTYFLKTLKLKAEPRIGDIWEH